MKILKLLILLSIGSAMMANAADGIASDQTYDKAKIAAVTEMYEQDIANEGMDYPVVLQQYADKTLKAAMQAEQDYFDREQMSCHVGYDVLWNSQDPDYSQDKQFSISESGWVQVSLAQGGSVYFDLVCDAVDSTAKCQVADVIMDEDGASLREYLLETCQ